MYMFCLEVKVNNIHIVIDSTAHADSEFINQHKNLHVVPLKLVLGDKEYNEDEITNEELFDKVKATKAFPKTSQPPIGDFVNLFTKLVDEGNKVIVITVSAGLSGTIQGATNAANMVNKKDIKVIDSGTTAVGMLRLAEKAVAMVEEGVDFDEIVDRLQQCANATNTVVITDTLEYLYKGGRIGGAAALFGTIMQIKPVMALEDGKIIILDKVRTRNKSITRMIEELAKFKAFDYIGIAHIAAYDEALKLKERLQQIYPDTRITVTTGGAVLASHLGPGVLSLMYQERI